MSAGVPTDASLSLYLQGLDRHGYAYLREEDGRIYLSIPERLPFEDVDDIQQHEVRGEQTLFDLANMYYGGMLEVPEDAIDIIAQFQDDPIVDVMVPLDVGRIIAIPPPWYFQEVVYGDSLAETPEV